MEGLLDQAVTILLPFWFHGYGNPSTVRLPHLLDKVPVLD
jgi:hypothetical protein